MIPVNKIKKPSAAERKAQSARDKAAAAAGSGGGKKMQKTAKLPRNPESGMANVFPQSRTSQKVSKNMDYVEFDEYIQDVNGSVGFAATLFSVNPGLAATFPLGSKEAILWTEWKMERCHFYYKPEVSAFASQGTTGKVILAMDYNAANPAPTTKQQVEIMDHVDAMPYAGDTKPLVLALDAGQVNRADSKYIRSSAVPAGGDIKTYDGGNFWFCTYGQPGATVIGEIRVRYRFCVRKPTLLNGAAAQSAKITTLITQHASTSFTSATPKAIVWDTSQVDALGWGVGAVGVFTPPAGVYLVRVQGSFYDTATELLTVILEIMKNGVSLPVKCLSHVTQTLSSGDAESQSVFAVVACNGTDTVQATVTMTGAAGTLTCLADAAQICVTPA
jgi:hypothetical protein